MLRGQRRKLLRSHPVPPGHCVVGSGGLPSLKQVLAFADHGGLDRCSAEPGEGPADGRRALQRGEQTEEQHA